MSGKLLKLQFRNCNLSVFLFRTGISVHATCRYINFVMRLHHFNDFNDFMRPRLCNYSLEQVDVTQLNKNRFPKT
jgi:hypothetical protein